MILKEVPYHVLGKSTDPFGFIVIGDMPYTTKDYQRFKRLITTINDLSPRLTAHLGDVKKAKTRCTASIYRKIKELFETIHSPVIYTPGDNDWADCCPKKYRGLSPSRALKIIRETLYPAPLSLGGIPISIVRQGDLSSEFRAYVENCCFVINSVLFVTVHIIGGETERITTSEYQVRSRANIAWLKATFTYAQKNCLRGIVILTHANLRYYAKERDRRGFDPILMTLGKFAAQVSKPCLLIQGDKHEFIIDQPPLLPRYPEGLANFTRLQVMGGKRQVHGVVVRADLRDPRLFSFRAMIVPKNLTRKGQLYG